MILQRIFGSFFCFSVQKKKRKKTICLWSPFKANGNRNENNGTNWIGVDWIWFVFVCLLVCCCFFLKIETSERFAARKQKVAKSTNRGESKFERRWKDSQWRKHHTGSLIFHRSSRNRNEVYAWMNMETKKNSKERTTRKTTEST